MYQVFFATNWVYSQSMESSVLLVVNSFQQPFVSLDDSLEQIGMAIEYSVMKGCLISILVGIVNQVQIFNAI